MENDSVFSDLQLTKLVFDEVNFKRLGFESEVDFEYEVIVNFGLHKSKELYRVELILDGEKPKEYALKIVLVGYFAFDSNKDYDEDFKRMIISSNAVAIMMPYLRSQLTLLTTQPGVKPLMLPIFNVNNMLESKN